jgi:hypothetical protein
MKKPTLGVLLYFLILLQSCGYSPTWRTETVDGENSSVGKFTSIALDSNNNPHISYYDEDNKIVKYAFKDSSGWQVETIESGVSMYEHSSIIVDANGNPHISYSTREYYVIEYTEVNKSELKHAYKNSTGWHIETVISDEYIGGYTDLNFPSLAFDKNHNPCITYFHYRCQWPCSRPGDSYLKYAYKDATGWHTETTDIEGYSGMGGLSDGRCASLGFDSNNNPHIGYMPYLYPPLEDAQYLKHAYKDSSGWHVETIDSGRTIGISTSISIDSIDMPHLSYHASDQYNEKNCLKYTYKDSSGWHIETIDRSGDVGRYNAIALDSRDMPHISYYDSKNKELKYAYKDSISWQIQTVDNKENVGSYTAIALDANGNPHISYYDATNKDLKYAYLGYQQRLSRYGARIQE